MKSEWKVSSNYVCGYGKTYSVYRIKNIDEIDHSGNREYATGSFDDKYTAQELADEMNASER